MHLGLEVIARGWRDGGREKEIVNAQCIGNWSVSVGEHLLDGWCTGDCFEHQGHAGWDEIRQHRQRTTLQSRCVGGVADKSNELRDLSGSSQGLDVSEGLRHLGVGDFTGGGICTVDS
jgi:hypothetical protein